MKQIGFNGIQNGDAVVTSIDNGPEPKHGEILIQDPMSVRDLPLLEVGYKWEKGFLFIEVEDDAPDQIINFYGMASITSVPFENGFPIEPISE